ncbi:MAG: hypothetical protein LBC49_00520 [Bacteroidales bacterium]|jgi:hypothetical protein|nr:hypothetical protein [Bacteroidales bacterium]
MLIETNDYYMLLDQRIKNSESLLLLQPIRPSSLRGRSPKQSRRKATITDSSGLLRLRLAMTEVVARNDGRKVYEW